MKALFFITMFVSQFALAVEVQTNAVSCVGLTHKGTYINTLFYVDYTTNEDGLLTKSFANFPGQDSPKIQIIKSTAKDGIIGVNYMDVKESYIAWDEDDGNFFEAFSYLDDQPSDPRYSFVAQTSANWDVLDIAAGKGWNYRFEHADCSFTAYTPAE